MYGTEVVGGNGFGPYIDPAWPESLTEWPG